MPAKNFVVSALKEKALHFRKEILEVLHAAGSGHPGGSLSAVEIFISLYFYKLNYRASDPHWEDRDRVIVSKGHCTPVVYVTLAEAGFFPREELKTFRKFGSRLQGHVHHKVPGVEFNTGSLGHGLSVANGIALGARILDKKFKIYCILGDGELQEGSIWEAAMSAAHHKLQSVCAIVDNNQIQENGLLREIKNVEPLAEKWRSFGWHAIEVDGHDFNQLKKALDEFDSVQGKPTVIIAHTIKGKGISFMELKAGWHGKAPNKEQLENALAELGGKASWT